MASIKHVSDCMLTSPEVVWGHYLHLNPEIPAALASTTVHNALARHGAWIPQLEFNATTEANEEKVVPEQSSSAYATPLSSSATPRASSPSYSTPISSSPVPATHCAPVSANFSATAHSILSLAHPATKDKGKEKVDGYLETKHSTVYVWTTPKKKEQKYHSTQKVAKPKYATDQDVRQVDAIREMLEKKRSRRPNLRKDRTETPQSQLTDGVSISGIFHYIAFFMLCGFSFCNTCCKSSGNCCI